MIDGRRGRRIGDERRKAILEDGRRVEERELDSAGADRTAVVVVVVTPLERVERPDVARWRDRHPFASEEIEALVDPPDLDLGGSGKTCLGREIAVDEHPSPVLVDELVPGERVHVHLAEVPVARIERRACGFAVITPSMVITPSISPSQPGCRCAAPRRPRLRAAHRPLFERNNAMPRSEFASRLRTCGERTRSDPARHRLPPQLRYREPRSSCRRFHGVLCSARSPSRPARGIPGNQSPGWHAHCATCRSTSTSPAPSAEAQIKPVALRPERKT